MSVCKNSLSRDMHSHERLLPLWVKHQRSFCDNFGKCAPILINYFTVAFNNEVQKKVLHNPPPHLKSVAALPCETWMFNCTTLHDSYSFKSVTSRLFTVNIYRNVIFWIICLCQLIYNIKRAFKISVISTHTCFASCMPLSMVASMTHCCNAITSV